MTVAAFRKLILENYKKNKRDLPWRNTKNPYRIWISEVMLQQTQVDRVVPRYLAFLKEFPTITSLANAPLQKVLLQWQGLGYNRRALAIYNAAKIMQREFGGRVPREYEELLALPGIGSYTASAILVFAHNKPQVLIETNIRSVYLHFFFTGRNDVSDKEILPITEKTLHKKDPRNWYHALMDYGAKLKKEGVNPSRNSAHHIKQSRFEGSARQMRGLLLRKVLSQNNISRKELLKLCGNKKMAEAELQALVKEGMLCVKGETVSVLHTRLRKR